MTVKPYLPCREVIEFLADYLDGSLPAETRVEFERHLAVCASCTAYLASYRETIRVARSVDDVVKDAPEDLIEAILKSRRSS